MNLVHSQAQGQHLDEQSRGWNTCSHHHPLHRWDTEAHTGHPSAPYPARFNINPTPHTRTHHIASVRTNSQQPTFPPQPPFHHTPTSYQPSPKVFITPPIPNDFVTSPDFHDCRVIFGHDLPKTVRRTPWSERLGIADCPIETLSIIAITRHSWSSHWLRNICHGLETHPVYTRSVAHAVFLSELLSRITQHRLDLDRAALAHCRCATRPIPSPTRKAALADEFMEYLSGLIHDPPNPKDDTSDPKSIIAFCSLSKNSQKPHPS